MCCKRRMKIDQWPWAMMDACCVTNVKICAHHEQKVRVSKYHGGQTKSQPHLPFCIRTLPNFATKKKHTLANMIFSHLVEHCEFGLYVRRCWICADVKSWCHTAPTTLAHILEEHIADTVAQCWREVKIYEQERWSVASSQFFSIERKTSHAHLHTTWTRN